MEIIISDLCRSLTVCVPGIYCRAGGLIVTLSTNASSAVICAIKHCSRLNSAMFLFVTRQSTFASMLLLDDTWAMNTHSITNWN
jgi:hypothetical protein